MSRPTAPKDTFIHAKGKFLFFIILLITLSSSSLSQDRDLIRFVGEFPSSSTISRPGILKTLGNIILGSGKINLNTPVDLIASDPQTLWVLSQGNRLLINIKSGRSSIPSAIRRSKQSMPSLVGICSDNINKRVLFTDSFLNSVFSITEDGKSLDILNDSLILDQPTGIAFSSVSGEIWVVETGAHRVAVIDGNGSLIRYIGKRGTGKGEFNFPTHIWIDSSGRVYIIDSMNFRIQIFDNEGRFITDFGEIGNASGFFARPKGVATDSNGNIYIADALFHTIQIFDRDGKYLYNFGSQGHNQSEFWMPGGIYIDENDYIYVSDTYNHRIQVFQLNADNYLR